jgi:hypothetical protein
MEIYPSSPRELLTMMASTSTQIDIFSDGVIESVQGGEINPLTVLIQLKAMEKASERILKEIRPNLLTEAAKHPGNEFEYMGNKITKAEHGIKYDYLSCGDPVYNELLFQLGKLTDKMKSRESFLRSINGSETVIDEKFGEVCKVTPPIKKSTPGLNVSIK